ncbi:unnamed protein product, partial [Anisakis simplex]|uniref:DET1- and DDB1-associated protein 1 n=1 Tax=Anisakis simplex TaxID=6269 RepID=A0A0M3JLA8_ANISI
MIDTPPPCSQPESPEFAPPTAKLSSDLCAHQQISSSLGQSNPYGVYPLYRYESFTNVNHRKLPFAHQMIPICSEETMSSCGNSSGTERPSQYDVERMRSNQANKLLQRHFDVAAVFTPKSLLSSPSSSKHQLFPSQTLQAIQHDLWSGVKLRLGHLQNVDEPEQ